MNLQTRHTMESRLVYQADGTPRRVLYADDDPMSLDINVAILRVMGFELHLAFEPNAALDLVHHSAFDFIILGFHLQQGASHYVAQQIRSLGGFDTNTRLLALTDEDLAHDHGLSVPRVFDSVLTRLPSRHGFRLALAKVLDQRPNRKPMQDAAAERNPAALQALPLPALPRFVLPDLDADNRNTLPPPAPVFQWQTPVSAPPVSVVAQAPPPAMPLQPLAPVVPAIPLSSASHGRTKWRQFSLGLPEEFNGLVMKIAVMQAQCFIVEIAKAGAARNNLAVIKAHRKLQSLAETFEMRDVTRLLEQHAGSAIAPHTQALSDGLERWQAGRPRVMAAA